MDYKYGGDWHDAIEWFNFDLKKVVGWKKRIPEVGDILLTSTNKYVFKEITRCSDPKDMFFGIVEELVD